MNYKVMLLFLAYVLASVSLSQGQSPYSSLASLSNKEKCGFKVPAIMCQMYAYDGDMMLYDSNRKQCRVINCACSCATFIMYAFRDKTECEESCVTTDRYLPLPPTPPKVTATTLQPIITVTPQLTKEQKCEFEIPEVSCNQYTFGGDVIIYDSEVDQCRIENCACDCPNYKAHAFTNQQDCERACVKTSQVSSTVPTSTQNNGLSNEEKCKFELPTIMCQMYAVDGDVMIYDSDSGECRIENCACDCPNFKAHAFTNKQDCENACIISKRPTPTPAPTPAPTPSSGLVLDNKQKCAFEIPDIMCQMYAFDGDVIVFDTDSNQCRVINCACDCPNFKAHAFSTIEDCEMSCIANDRIPPVGLPASDTVTATTATAKTTQPATNTQKCGFIKPEVMCFMYVPGGDLIVYDSTTKQCHVMNCACSCAYMRQYAFQSLQECESSCITPGNEISVSQPATTPQTTTNVKCSIRQLAQSPFCAFWMWGSTVYLYDANRGQCLSQNTACLDSATIARYGFSSLQECQSKCATNNPPTTSTVPSPSWFPGTGSASANSRKCYYQRYWASCPAKANSPTYITFDSFSRRCVSEQNSCDPSYMAAYAFSTMSECTNTCVRRFLSIF